MNSDAIAKICRSLTKQLSEQGVDVDSRSAAFKLMNGSDGNATLYIAMSSVESVISEAHLDILKDAGYLLDAGQPTRISWGSSRPFAVGVAWSKLMEHAQKASVGTARVSVLERRVKTLEKELKDAQESSYADIAMGNLLETVAKTYRGAKAKTASPSAKRRKVSESGDQVATLVLSDWHWGEKVVSSRVNGMNEYNLEIADKRATRIFESAIQLLNPTEGKYDAIVVPILGDMLSGIIHDELLLTNDAPLIECIMSLVAKLEWGLFELSQLFPFVQVPCVYGNHGRMDKKKTFKDQAALNFETMVYQLLEKLLKARLGDQCNVSFQIGTSSDLMLSVYDKQFKYTHGDQFSEEAGTAFDKVRKGDMAKRKRAYEAKQPVHDYLVCGHFHTYGSFGGIVMNGSLVGYNEYAFNKNLPFERPQQALFVNHRHCGITQHMPVFADDSTVSVDVADPVSVSRV